MEAVTHRMTVAIPDCSSSIREVDAASRVFRLSSFHCRRVYGAIAAGMLFSATVFGQLASVAPDTQRHYDLAQRFMQAGKFREAEAEFLRALALDPERDEILLDLARLHIRGNSLDEAEQNLREYLATHPESRPALGLAGEVKFRQKDSAAAEQYLLRMLELSPDDAIAHKLLALCYTADGRWDLARPHLDRAVLLSPNDEENHYWRGRCLLETAHYDAAIAEFRRTLALRPDYLKAYDNLGVCYDQLQKPLLARENYLKAIEIDRRLGARYVWPYINLGSLLNHMRRYQEAVDLLSTVVPWDPDSAAVRYHLGRARLALRQYDAAESDLLRASQLDPTLALPHYQLGRLYKETGKTEESRRHLQAFVRLARPSEGNRSLY